MAFNYNKLRGRIVEKFRTQKAFAQAAGVSENTITDKLSGKTPISHSDVILWNELLGIETDEIGSFYYAPEVLKSEPEEVQS